MGHVVFRHQDHARSILVQPVDDPRPARAANTCQIGAVIQNRVDQRPVPIARGWMHHHARGLVDHQQIGILVQHVQRDRLRLGRVVLGRGEDDGDLFACRELMTGLQRP